MPRRPAILAFVLLLLLSIGGVVFHHHLRQHRPPSFEEVDAFLKNQAATGGWRFNTYVDVPPYTDPRHTWLGKLGISPRVTVKHDQYILTHERTVGTMVIGIIRHDGDFERITFSGVARAKHGKPYPEADDFRNITLFGKFPQLRVFQKSPCPANPPSSSFPSSFSSP